MTIDSCYEKLRDAETNQITLYSDPHFIWGYKLRLKVDFNVFVAGRGTLMSVFIDLMNNGRDMKPFNKTVSFILIHQDDQSKSIKRTKDILEIDGINSIVLKSLGLMKLGITRFISLEEIHDGGFIKNDTLYIRCVVE